MLSSALFLAPDSAVLDYAINLIKIKIDELLGGLQGGQRVPPGFPD